MRALAITLLLTCVQLLAAASTDTLEAAYTAWSQGRPIEALPALHEAAVTSDRWDAWLDLGLAAAAADQNGPAVAWLLKAHERAPTATEPLEALRALGCNPPASATARIGPLALPGTGILAAVLLLLGCGLLGYATFARQRRLSCLIAGILLSASTLPGIIAAWLDSQHHLAAVVSPSHLLDSTGTPLEDGAVAPGTLAQREPREAWNGRILVTLEDERRGWLPIASTEAPTPQ